MQFIAQAMLFVFLAAWVTWLFPFDDLLDRSGTPLGADYSMFYVAGGMVLDDSADRLYDQAEHQRRLQALFPGIDESFCLPYRYPPFVALLMAPLSALPYAVSYGCFLALSCAAWWTAIGLLATRLRILRGPWRRPILWAAAGWPLAWETLIGGQASMLLLLILCVTFVLLRIRRYVWAGAVLALAAYKPNALLFVGFALIVRYPRMLRGAVPVALCLGLLSLVPAGWTGLSDFVGLSSQLTLQPWDVETPFWKVHGLATWFAVLPGEHERVCLLLWGAFVAGLVALVWRRSRARESVTAPMAMAVLVSVNALCNAYTPIYDLSLLLAGSLFTAESLARRYGQDVAGRFGWAQLLIATIYFGPHLSQFLARSTGLQPFALALLVITIWQIRHFERLANVSANRLVNLRPARSLGS